MVKLEESLGSIEKVLDEYLLSLQVDIDLTNTSQIKSHTTNFEKKSF